MAKKIVYDIIIDSTESQASIKRVEERLNELNQSANASQKEINTLQRELQELGQTNSDKAVEGVQSLRREYRRLIEELQQTEEGTEAFNRLAQEAGRVKDRIDGVNDSVQNFNKSPFENILSNFRQLRQRIFDLDFDGFNQSFKDLRTNLGNVGTSFIGIQRGAGLAVNGLKIFKVALAATGIGLLVAAIGVLITNFDDLKKSGGLIGGAFTLLGNIFKAFTTAVLKLSDGLGLTSNAYQTFLKKSDETVDSTSNLNDEIKKLKEELDGVDFDGKITEQLKEYNKQVKELEKEQLNLLKLQTTSEVQSRKEIKQIDTKLAKNKELAKTLETITDVITGRYLAEKSGIEALGTGGPIIDETIGEAIRDLTDTAQKEAIKRIGIRLKELETNRQNVLKVEKDISDKKAKIEELNSLRLRKIEKDRQSQISSDRQKAFDNTIKLLEEEQKRRLIILLKDFKDEEDLKIKTEKLDIEFLEKRKRINQQFGLSTADIEIALAQKVIDKKLELEKKLKEDVDKILSQKIEVEVAPFTTEERRPEDVKNANEKIGLLEKEVQVRQALNNAQLENPEIPNLEQSILLSNERLRILEEYGLKDSQLYLDAINQKKILEAELTRAIKDENEKRLDDEAQSLEDRRKQNIQYANQIVSTVGGLTNQIQAFTNQRYDNEIARAGENQQEINRIAKEQFETNKAFGIVSSIINTSMAIMNIWANTPNPIAAGILTGVVAAIGAVEIATIASQEFQPGQAASSSFTPNAQGSQSLGSVSAFTPNVNFASAGTGANIQTAGGGSAQSVQFTGSISVSEINNAQQNISIFETGSLLGGG